MYDFSHCSVHVQAAMRITADVEVNNRLLPSFNMKGKGRSLKAQLSVGRKPGSDSKDPETHMLICTKQNPAGTFYRVSQQLC